MGIDLCATCKLAEGIKKFAEDTEKLEQFFHEKIVADKIVFQQ